MVLKFVTGLSLAYFLFMGMSLTTNEPSRPKVIEEAKPFRDRFVKYSEQCLLKNDAMKTEIRMGDVSEEKYVATCFYLSNKITINEKIWKQLTSEEKEQTIFHELAHCVLSLNHDDQNLNIMNTGGFIPKGTYTSYYDYFIRKLFKDCQKPLIEKFEYEEYK